MSSETMIQNESFPANYFYQVFGQSDEGGN